ncbi:MAG: hypothetical protein EOO60_01860 [Hymenobacter sp.]|nr:MAG: hypothetical protein EOO60_01860 [Hymenobacter sp.]
MSGNCRGNFRSPSDFSHQLPRFMKKMILAAGALLGAALAQASCQAPAQPAPISEPIAIGQQATARKPAPAKPSPLRNARWCARHRSPRSASPASSRSRTYAR